MVDLSKIRFYENGVVSFNLPLSAQVVGAKATRTTHPRVLNGFSQLFSLVSERAFAVENPFLWKTKAEVLDVLKAADCTQLIKHSVSCTHTWEMTNYRTHCGKCSQCIDRRFAALAADLGEEDPPEMYGVDLLTGEREPGEPRTMLAEYVNSARRITKMSPLDFYSKYGETSRLLKQLEGSPDSNALKIFELHKRHAQAVTNVVEQAIKDHSGDILNHSLPSTSLINLVCAQPRTGSPTEIRQTASEESAPPVEQVQLGDYAFKQNGEAWSVRFNGSAPRILLPCKGAAYLSILLANPGEQFPVEKLYSAVAKQPKEFFLGDAGVETDDIGLGAYRLELDNLREQLAEAESNNDIGTIGKIQRDIGFYEDALRAGSGLGGRLRKAKDDRDRIRKAVSNAIERARKKIHSFNPELATHLKSPNIRKGFKCLYQPISPVKWDT